MPVPWARQPGARQGEGGAAAGPAGGVSKVSARRVREKNSARVGRRRPTHLTTTSLSPHVPTTNTQKHDLSPPAAFFGLAGVAYTTIPRVFSSRAADDMPTLSSEWKRATAKRALAYEREGAPGAPVVLDPISRDM